MRYPHNGVVASYQYNDARLLTQMENRRRDSVISSWRNEYYLDGNQSAKTNQDGNTTTYAYDRYGQLTEEIDPSWQTIRYKYDRFGNRAAMTVSGCEEYQVEYRYHPNNWLLTEEKRSKDSVEVFRYQYDANGNQCYRRWERSNLIATQTPGSLGFTSASFREVETLLDLREYDGFGRLISAQRDGTKTSYRYRPDGLRHSRTTNDRKSECTTMHHWDGLNMVADENERGVYARYLRGAGLICQQIDDQQFFYLFNDRGDIMQRVGRNGSLSPAYEYDAFGNERKPINTDPNPFRYAGEYLDQDSGDYYLRNRCYSTANGRFTQEDPIRSGRNWYAYCDNNPVMFVDPLGLVSSNWNNGRSTGSGFRSNDASNSGGLSGLAGLTGPSGSWGTSWNSPWSVTSNWNAGQSTGSGFASGGNSSWDTWGSSGSSSIIHNSSGGIDHVAMDLSRRGFVQSSSSINWGAIGRSSLGDIAYFRRWLEETHNPQLGGGYWDFDSFAPHGHLTEDPNCMMWEWLGMEPPQGRGRLLLYGAGAIALKKFKVAWYIGGAVLGAADYTIHNWRNFSREDFGMSVMLGMATSGMLRNAAPSSPFQYTGYGARYVILNENLKRFADRWVPSQVPDINDPEAWLR